MRNVWDGHTHPLLTSSDSLAQTSPEFAAAVAFAVPEDSVRPSSASPLHSPAASLASATASVPPPTAVSPAARSLPPLALPQALYQVPRASFYLPCFIHCV